MGVEKVMNTGVFLAEMKETLVWKNEMKEKCRLTYS